MSDTLNSLLMTQPHSAGALPAPVVANPLAAISTGTQVAGQQVDLRQKQFNLQQAQLQPAYQAMRMLAATNPNATSDDITAALGGAARIGGNVDGVVQNLADWTARGGKPADFVRAYALGGMSAENQAQLGLGTMADVNTGRALVSGVRGGILSSAPGQFTPSSSIGLGLSPGEATEMVTINTPQGPVSVPKGVLYGTGVPGSGGQGGGGVGATGGVGGSTLLPPGAPATVAAARIDQISQRESGNQNILNRQGPGGTPLSTASGPYQFLDSTWQQAAREYGIQNPTQRAMDTDPAIQRAVAIKFIQAHGEQPWATSAPGGGGGGSPGGPASGPFIGATSAQPVAGGATAQPAGAGSPVQPAAGGGIPSYDQYGRPIGQGGGGGGGGPAIPGVTYTPQGPIIRPTSPYEQPQLEQSSKDYVADQVNNKTLSRRIAPLQNAISIIKENPGLVTGPSSENWYQWVQGLAAGAGIDVGDVHNANAYNELAKQLAMNLQQSGADPSDMARLMHEASQPNTMQGKQAIVTLAAEQIGYQRLKSAQYLEFRSRHPTDANSNAQFYNQETGDWAGQQDPMAYAADLVPQAELQAHLRGLNKDQQRAFVESLTNAKRLFKLKLPTGGQNGG